MGSGQPQGWEDCVPGGKQIDHGSQGLYFYLFIYSGHDMKEVEDHWSRTEQVTRQG